MRIKKKRFVLK